MIVRILGEGRYDVPEAKMAEIESSDARLTAAMDSDDEAAFASALSELVGAVRAAGTHLPADDLQTSGLVVPHEGSSLAEVRSLLNEDS